MSHHDASVDAAVACRVMHTAAAPHLLLAMLLAAAGTGAAGNAAAQARVLDEGMHRLRMGDTAEWSATVVQPHQPALEVTFQAAEANATEHTLAWRQAGVRRTWTIEINGEEIARLYPDENPHLMHYGVPAGVLRPGDNRLRIAPLDTLPDDIEIGEIALHTHSRAEHLGAAALEIGVLAEDSAPLPARITIVDERRALVELGTETGGLLAVRPGVVYTGIGRASLRIPAGEYRVYATRGFEYGVDSVQIGLEAGERAEATLRIAREVPTDGWVAADTHLHTFTHSGHGDATVEERVITIASEGLELPILTDHNVHVDLTPAAEARGVRRYFTPVVGNELTTPVGHFNLFPVPAAAPAPSPRVENWGEVRAAIEGVPGVRGIVLNHPRDIHSGFRPFGEGERVTLPGERSLGPESGAAAGEAWVFPANAMEVVNSGSQQSDPLELFRDWLEMLGRGYGLTPVGSSDSHDVARYIPGQARTYIRVDDRDPGRIDVPAAVERFRAGAVMVSFGLLAELTVEGSYGPGDTVPTGDDELEVTVRVLGPSWIRADRVSLYVNGERVHTQAVEDAGVAGVKWSGTWRIPRPPAGSHIVALAEGPDPQRPFWPIASPYQSTSPEVAPQVIGLSGAVWVD